MCTAQCGRDHGTRRPLLGSITAPTLVIVPSDDVWLSAENSHYLAENIAGSRLIELSGLDHDPWVGDTEPLLRAVEDFISAAVVAQKM
jgi:pimeloyl-ACP methyl ester carboxylesterase